MTTTSAGDEAANMPASTSRPSAASSRTTAAVMVLAALISLIPVFTVRFPPMTDYANHYVRLWLLSGGIETPQMAAFYSIDWNVAWTNIAIDLIAAALGKVTSMDVIGPFVLGLALLLPPIGVALVNRRLFGGFHWWQLLCFTLAWNAVFLFGFLSFSISLGLALIFASVDDALKSRGLPLAIAARAASAAVLLVAHPFGLLFYAALLAALAFGPSVERLKTLPAFSSATRRVALAIAPVFLPLAILFLFGPSLPGERHVSLFASMVWDSPTILRQAMLLLTYFRTYDLRVDLVYLVLMIVLVREAARYGLLQVHLGLTIAALVLGFVALFMPAAVFDTGGIDRRLPCMMALCAAAGLRPNVSGRLQTIVLPAALFVVITRVAFIDYVWLQRSADVTSVETVLQSVPAGSKILPLEYRIDNGNLAAAPVGRMVADALPSFWHYPAIATFERAAFMPYLFTAAGKQPLRVNPPFTEISVPEAIPFPVQLLRLPLADLPSYMSDWQNRFDYALVLNADMENPARLMPELPFLHLVSDQGFARLYRIEHPTGL